MLRIRLRREGSRNHPYYRIVVSDSRSTPTGRMVEIIGQYDPKRNPAMINIDMEKYENWVAKGAKPSDSAASLYKQLKRAATSAEGASA